MSVVQAEERELEVEHASGGLWSDAWERLIHNKGAIVGAVIISLFVIMAVFAPLIAPYGPNERVAGLSATPPGPSSEFIFGLDEQGRDLFTLIVFGARLSLLVGIVSVAVGLTFGLLLGATAGYLGGKVDTAIMRIVDIVLSVPGLLFAIALVTLLGRGLVQVMVAVGITTIPVFARLLRGSMLGVRESDYVLAARSVGTPGRGLLLTHILPNSIAPVIVAATLAMATAIIDVAGLSYLGLGPANPGLPEWGAILAENQDRMQRSPHLVFFPGFAIVFSVLAINLIGDGLREAIDPKLRK